MRLLMKRHYSMAFNIRCISCGAIINHKYDAYVKRVEELRPQEDCKGKALDDCGIYESCCRMHFLTYEPSVHNTNIKYNLKRYENNIPDSKRMMN